MAKTQAEIDDDRKYRNRFRDGGNDEPMKRHQKKVWDRSAGKHVAAAPRMDTTAWYKKKLGIGEKKGEGALAKRRKKTLDTKIADAGG